MLFISLFLIGLENKTETPFRPQGFAENDVGLVLTENLLRIFILFKMDYLSSSKQTNLNIVVYIELPLAIYYVAVLQNLIL